MLSAAPRTLSGTSRRFAQVYEALFDLTYRFSPKTQLTAMSRLRQAWVVVLFAGWFAAAPAGAVTFSEWQAGMFTS